MRLFIFTGNIVIGLLLLFTESTKTLANTTTTVPKQQSRLVQISDVWTRIRLGTKISQVQSQKNDVTNYSEKNSTKALVSRTSNLNRKTNSDRLLIFPKTADTPMYRYTEYGRLKHNVLVFKNTHNQTDFDSIKVTPSSGSYTKPFINHALSLSASISTHRTNIKPQHPHKISQYDRIHKHIDWYTHHSDYLHEVTERARPYLYHIVESLSQHHLPYDLALLPIVESSYQANALSSKSAAGLWQFIPRTGHDFDLHQSKHYDDRLDITASTLAAMRYLTYLNQHFHGDWLLALAAYNCGQGTVDNAVKSNLADGIAVDYWSLHLPEETQEYVPRFLALSNIFANPNAHGLKLNQLKNEPYFVHVKIDQKHDIEYLAEKDFKELAQLANLSYEQFSRLNPGYFKLKLPLDGPFRLIMPAINADQLHQRLTSINLLPNKSAAVSTNL